ncbi:hypothetical protein SAMN04488089_103155 [Myroides profundi]|uniref:Uncharacterized protein n=1 Tax=Myroides profundi TaxID=480520 RepID=A0AAJ5BD83_MYRPR|nr:hypothetical protein SAMN04488089_103155 [Myroides profundi]
MLLISVLVLLFEFMCYVTVILSLKITSLLVIVATFELLIKNSLKT